MKDLTVTEMACGTCVEPGRFALTTAPLPQEAPAGQVLVDITAVGICGTDYHIFQGKHPFLNYPRVIGHELSGRVVEAAHGFDAGQLVILNPYLSCGRCRACLKGRPNCCEDISVLGVHRDGGMCARITVPAGNLYAADGLSETEAAMVEFLAIGAHAVSRSGIEPGDRVLVTGAGPIGLGTALFARIAGGEVHLLDVSAKRLALARERFGFDALHVVGDDPGRFDVVFDATGNTAAIEAGFAYLGHASSYVLVSVVKDDIRFNDAEFHKREARIIGSRNALRADFEHVADALRSGRIDAQALLSETIPLRDLPDRFAALAENRETLIKAIVTPLR